MNAMIRRDLVAIVAWIPCALILYAALSYGPLLLMRPWSQGLLVIAIAVLGVVVGINITRVATLWADRSTPDYRQALAERARIKFSRSVGTSESTVVLRFESWSDEQIYAMFVALQEVAETKRMVVSDDEVARMVWQAYLRVTLVKPVCGANHLGEVGRRFDRLNRDIFSRAIACPT